MGTKWSVVLRFTQLTFYNTIKVVFSFLLLQYCDLLLRCRLSIKLLHSSKTLVLSSMLAIQRCPSLFLTLTHVMVQPLVGHPEGAICDRQSI